MKGFFAHLYEWFGWIHIYSKDMSDFLKGWDYACVGYFALPWYFYVGVLMVIVTVLVFALQYDLISGTRFKTVQHWELAALVVVIVNFLIAFSVPFVAILQHTHCPMLKLSVSDCVLFGLSNAVWAFILFSILSIVSRIGNPIRT
jgi:hypothetical protein